jgi:acetate kinase
MSDDAVLVVNAGSSSIKFAVYDEALRRLFHGHVELTSAGHEAAIAAALARIEAQKPGWSLVAAGHRVVHGGDRFSAPTRISPDVLRKLEALCPLAPLHQPHNLAAIRAVAARRPDLPQVACFDTAFHQTQPALARLFALPKALTDAGIKRYGFHGLSYEYVAMRLPEVLGACADGKVIAAHLGNGASLCAMERRASVASTMGFTALEGLMMGTRTGAIDPGVLLYLLEEKHMTAPDLERLLYRESGLLGVSGLSNDMRTLLASPDPRAKLAVDLFVYRAAREIGSLAAALGGLDALVFTAGIGEHAAEVRAAVCKASRWLGVEIDSRANSVHGTLISTPQSRVAVAVLPTNEELMIARHTFALTAREKALS